MNVAPISQYGCSHFAMNLSSSTVSRKKLEELCEWVKETFYLIDLPSMSDVFANYRVYRAVKTYLLNRSSYLPFDVRWKYLRPVKMFLDNVYDPISKGRFQNLSDDEIHNQLKKSELACIELDRHSKTMEPIVKHAVHLAVETPKRIKEAEDLGVRWKVEWIDSEKEEEDIPPSLEDLCAKVLMNNGMPHQYLSDDEIHNQLKKSELACIELDRHSKLMEPIVKHAVQSVVLAPKRTQEAKILCQYEIDWTDSKGEEEGIPPSLFAQAFRVFIRHLPQAEVYFPSLYNLHNEN